MALWQIRHVQLMCCHYNQLIGKWRSISPLDVIIAESGCFGQLVSRSTASWKWSTINLWSHAGDDTHTPDSSDVFKQPRLTSSWGPSPIRNLTSASDDVLISTSRWSLAHWVCKGSINVGDRRPAMCSDHYLHCNSESLSPLPRGCSSKDVLIFFVFAMADNWTFAFLQLLVIVSGPCLTTAVLLKKKKEWTAWKVSCLTNQAKY